MRAQPRIEITPSKSSTQASKGHSDPRHHNATKATNYSLSSSGDDKLHRASTTFSDLMPRRQGDIFSASLAERRQQQPPTPLQVGDGRNPDHAPLRVPMEPVPHAVSPLSAAQGGRYDEAVSEHPSFSWPSPQTVWLPSGNAGLQRIADDNVNGPVVDMYTAWARLESPSDYADPSPRTQSLARRPRRSKSTSDGLRRPDEFAPASPPPPPPPAKSLARSSGHRAADSPLFSPLALYFRGQDFPSTRKGEKTLIGQNGWLERTEFVTGREHKASQKKTGILESIKKIAKDVVSHSRRDRPWKC